MFIDEYKKCAEICSRFNSSDKNSVKNNNQAVSRMYKIVEKVSKEGDEAIEKLAILLDDPISGQWLAHQLVEKINLPMHIENKCFQIIEKLAKEDAIGSMGEKIWLAEWKKKKNKN